MTKEEIEVVRHSSDTIPLKTGQFVVVQHDTLKFAVSIYWKHIGHELTLMKANGKQLSEHRPINLSTRNILLLNPGERNHEWVYRLEANNVSNKIDLIEMHDMSKYRPVITIIDRQWKGQNNC